MFSQKTAPGFSPSQLRGFFAVRSNVALTSGHFPFWISSEQQKAFRGFWVSGFYVIPGLCLMGENKPSNLIPGLTAMGGSKPC